jgi:hypothetical protein
MSHFDSPKTLAESMILLLYRVAGDSDARRNVQFEWRLQADNEALR